MDCFRLFRGWYVVLGLHGVTEFRAPLVAVGVAEEEAEDYDEGIGDEDLSVSAAAR